MCPKSCGQDDLKTAGLRIKRKLAEYHFGSIAALGYRRSAETALAVRIQPIDATHWLKRSAGVS
jgi:hypothetical protein